MQPQDQRSFHWAWIILATVFVDLFINYSIRIGYGVVLPEMISSLGFTRTDTASIYNSYLFAYVAITPFSGYLTDRLGARRVITTCALILGIGVILMGTIQELWTACLFYAIVGVGATGMWTPVLTVVQRWFTPRKRGLALGIISPGFGLGFAAMGAAFPWIVHHYTWRHAWYFLGAGALVMVLGNGLLLKSDPESSGYRPWGEKEGPSPPAPADRASPATTPVSAVFRNRNFWIIGFSYFAVACSLYGVTTFMVDYAKTQLGIPMEKASLLATVHGFAQVIGVLTLLPLSDYLGRKKAIVIMNSFIAASLFGIVLLGHSWGMLCFLVGLFAVFYGPTFPIYGACAGDYFPREVMGTVIGAWTPFYGLGAIMSHWATGLLRDSTGLYDLAFLANGGMALAGLVLILFVHSKPS
jgi:sugar phosphate permease